MKKRYPILLMAWLLVLTSVCVSFCAGDQAARYLANQNQKQLFLSEAKEDISILTSCLHPTYRSSSTKPEFTISSQDIARIIPTKQFIKPARVSDASSQEKK